MYKIAVLDDDEYWCLAIQRFFRKDFEVSTFTDAQNFLRSQTHYDLVLVDFTILPSSEFETIMNGCELIAHLKTHRQPAPIMILVSGFINQNDLDEGTYLCPMADAFLAKDAGLEVTLQKVNQLLQNESGKNVTSEIELS